MSQQIKVQVLFTEETAHGSFTDALYFTQEEFATKTQGDIDALKTERVNNYVTAIDEAKNAPVVEPTKEQLEAEKLQLQQSVAQLQAQLVEIDAKITTKVDVVDGGVIVNP